ncbi:MAG: GNAT family N-acetyltransferase [Bdellovibrionota bacterium]
MHYRDFEASQHLSEQRQLFSDCFPESHLASIGSTEHYQWKFRGLNATRPSYEYAAFDETRLVGYYAALPYRYRINGKKVLCGVVCDVMTHSSSRGKGIFTALGRHSLNQLQAEGIGFVSGYPIRPEVLPGHLKVGWKVAFSLPLYIKVLRVNSALKKAGLEGFAPFCNGLVMGVRLVQSIPALFRRKDSDGFETRVFEVEEFLGLSEYDAFFSRWSAQFQNVLQKDLEFLKWRLRAPGAAYRVLTVWSEGSLIAVSIVRKVEFNSLPCLAVLDLMSLTQEAAPLRALHGALEQECIVQGAETIAVMMSRTSARRAGLRAHGFIRSPKGFKLILNRLDSALNLDQLMEEKNWNLMWIDSDDL